MISLYKDITRRIQKLPLDSITIQKLQNHARAQFSKPFKKKSSVELRTTSAKKYIKCLQRLYENGGVLEADLKVIDGILDMAYKHAIPKPKWVTTFQLTPYEALEKKWPENHLIDAFVEKNKASFYWTTIENEKRVKEQPIISKVVDIMSDRAKTTFELKSLVKEQSEPPLLDEILNKVEAFHSFVSKHNSLLRPKHSLKPLAAHYPIHPTGGAIANSRRENIKRDAISYAKLLFNYSKPLLLSDALYLKSITEQNKVSLNQRYFKSRTKFKLSERTIRRRISAYLDNQFTVDTQGTYSLCAKIKVPQNFDSQTLANINICLGKNGSL